MRSSTSVGKSRLFYTGKIGCTSLSCRTCFEGKVAALPSELRQVSTNVIKNAVEAAGDGGEIRIFSEATQELAKRGPGARDR